LLGTKFQNPNELITTLLTKTSSVIRIQYNEKTLDQTQKNQTKTNIIMHYVNTVVDLKLAKPSNNVRYV
jgi:hypothetical protein